MKKKTKTQLHYWLWLALSAVTAAGILNSPAWANEYQQEIAEPHVHHSVNVPAQSQPEATKSQSGYLTPSQEAVKAQIIKIAKAEGYDAPLFLVRLATCESSLNPAAKNTHSSARGLFQILKAHKDVSDECAFDTTCSTKWTISQLKLGHASAWECTALID